MANPVVTIQMENGGKIVAELYPEVAPQSVRNFVSLASKGFYDGKIFHRVISGDAVTNVHPSSSSSLAACRFITGIAGPAP